MALTTSGSAQYTVRSLSSAQDKLFRSSARRVQRARRGRCALADSRNIPMDNPYCSCKPRRVRKARVDRRGAGRRVALADRGADGAGQPAASPKNSADAPSLHRC